ncbi:MAG: hypothetical protein AABX69_04535 [Nanoarchaeota archaeon]
MGKELAKRGQYIILDVFIALMMIAVGLLLMFSLRHSVSYSKQPIIISQDVAASLSSLKLAEINNPIVLRMIANGTINDTDNTVLQQIAEFYTNGLNHYAVELIRNVSAKIIPSQYGFEVRINDGLIYSRGSKQNNSEVLIASRKILSGVNKNTVEPWGPLIGEVTVWKQ